MTILAAWGRAGGSNALHHQVFCALSAAAATSTPPDDPDDPGTNVHKPQSTTRNELHHVAGVVRTGGVHT